MCTSGATCLPVNFRFCKLNTIKIQQIILVQYKGGIIMISLRLTCSCHDIVEKLLFALNYKNSLAVSICSNLVSFILDHLDVLFPSTSTNLIQWYIDIFFLFYRYPTNKIIPRINIFQYNGEGWGRMGSFMGPQIFCPC